MQVLVNTDNHVEGGEGLNRHVESVVQAALERFGNRVTRVEVHLSDENSGKKEGDNDKRCVMEARVGGLQPVTVSEDGATIDQCIDGAAEKLEKTLAKTVDRLGDAKGRTSFAGEQG